MILKDFHHVACWLACFRLVVLIWFVERVRDRERERERLCVCVCVCVTICETERFDICKIIYTTSCCGVAVNASRVFLCWA